MRGSCWPARPAASAPPEILRSAPPRSACWSPNRNCSASCATGSAPCRRSPPAAKRSTSRATARSPTPAGACTTSSTCPPTSSMPPTPMRRLSPARPSSSYLHVLAPSGMVSIPVSIRDFPVYALRMLATVRAALLLAGIADPAAHVIVYRSAWSVRILVSRDGWAAGPHRRRSQILRRPLLRPVLVSRHGCRQGAGRPLQ